MVEGGSHDFSDSMICIRLRKPGRHHTAPSPRESPACLSGGKAWPQSSSSLSLWEGAHVLDCKAPLTKSRNQFSLPENQIQKEMNL